VIVGYARVSTKGQDPAGQVAELEAAGCGRIFCEKASGAAGRRRRELARALATLAAGDVLVIVSLSRCARSARDALNILEAVRLRGAGFKSLREAWADTTTAHGRLAVTIFAGFAEFDREMILERTGEGRQAAKARGVVLGRRPTLTARQRAYVRQERAPPARQSLGQLAALLNVSRSTICRAARDPDEKRAAEEPAAQIDLEEFTRPPAPAG
jgi:DNA invertase Pin-like site-specific DNA recombinase